MDMNLVNPMLSPNKSESGEMEPEVPIFESTGNVFEDLGFEKKEAANLKHRARLMISLRSFIEENDLTQNEAAELFDVSQPRISDLVNQKMEKFSIDTLVNMHDVAGLRVHITVERPPLEDQTA